MKNIESFILKKRNIWFHIIISYLTFGIWIIVYFFIKYQSKVKESQKTKEPVAIKRAENKPIKYLSFNVNGITFKDRQNFIKNIIKSRKENDDIELYCGMTNKEIIENGEDVYEVNDEKLYSVRLEPTKYKNEDAIEVYIKDSLDSEEIMIGYCPTENISNCLDFLKKCNENPNYKIQGEAYITGGKFKTVDYDLEKDKEIIVVKENNYGVRISLDLYNK